MTMFEFTVYSAIQGHHVHKDISENPVIGEELKYQRDVVPSTTSYSTLNNTTAPNKSIASGGYSVRETCPTIVYVHPFAL